MILLSVTKKRRSLAQLTNVTDNYKVIRNIHTAMKPLIPLKLNTLLTEVKASKQDFSLLDSCCCFITVSTMNLQI